MWSAESQQPDITRLEGKVLEAANILGSAVQELNRDLIQVIRRYSGGVFGDFRTVDDDGLGSDERGEAILSQARKNLHLVWQQLTAELSQPLSVIKGADQKSLTLGSGPLITLTDNIIELSPGGGEIQINYREVQPFEIGEIRKALSRKSRLIVVNLLTCNSESRIDSFLENLKSDIARTTPEALVVLQVCLNNTTDDTLAHLQSQLGENTGFYSRIFEVPPDELLGLSSTENRNIAWNICMQRAQELVGQLESPEQTSTFIGVDDDISLITPASGNSVLEGLAIELESDPNLAAVSPTIQAAPMGSGQVHERHYYLSNVQKTVLEKALPKHHPYGACLALRLRLEYPWKFPAIQAPEQDVLLGYYLWNQQRQLAGGRTSMPVRTTTNYLFYHPEDNSLVSFFSRRWLTSDKLADINNWLERGSVEAVTALMHEKAREHRESVNELMAREYGVTSMEFLGGILYAEYLLRAMGASTYTA